ncbi:D-alanyl-D-alanine carboxypeptidase family protein [Bacillus marasmi]|uniref:D-alanyl-D-alanine carboxypeptidase family protein n=1 Tax=Bacillus marasmi TaxID=1926279 RepID=UPI0011CAA305|nr:D-alanyl-D-alanine carboxypeptidase family protein [Bacillus marasmi]
MKKILILVYLFIVALSYTPSVSAEDGNELLQLKSEAAVLMDSKTGAILFSKNGQEKMYPASLTKIATAIYAIESGKLEDTVVVSENAVSIEGTKVYLEAGEIVTLHRLLQGMLINSGNDAAMAIAEHLDGNLEVFSKNINTFLKKEIGVLNTHLVNPSGLFAEDHYTTAEDLAKITSYALNNNVFKEIFGTKELVWDGLSWDTTLFTHHQMLKGEVPYPGITGGKTGFVNESKQTLATTAANGDLNLTAILLKSNYKREIYNDTKQLFDFGFQNFKVTEIPVSKTFKVEEKTYQVSKPTYVTEPISGGILEVSNQGLLKVQTSENKTIQEIQLTEIEKQVIDEPNTSNYQKKLPISSMSVFFGMIVVLAAGATLTVIKKTTDVGSKK